MQVWHAGWHRLSDFMTTHFNQVRHLVSGQCVCVLEPEDVFKEPEGLIYEDDISRDSLLKKTSLPGFLGTFVQVLTELTDKYLSDRVGGTLNFSGYSLKKIYLSCIKSLYWSVLQSWPRLPLIKLHFYHIWIFLGVFNDNSTRKQKCSIDIYPFPKLVYWKIKLQKRSLGFHIKEFISFFQHQKKFKKSYNILLRKNHNHNSN